MLRRRMARVRFYSLAPWPFLVSLLLLVWWENCCCLRSVGSCHWLGFVLNWIGVINVVPKSGLVGCLESGLGSCLATHKILYSPFSGKLTRSHKIFVPGSFLGRPTPSVYNLQRSCKGIHRISGQGLYVKVAITSHFQELTRSLAL